MNGSSSSFARSWPQAGALAIMVLASTAFLTPMSGAAVILVPSVADSLPGGRVVLHVSVENGYANSTSPVLADGFARLEPQGTASSFSGTDSGRLVVLYGVHGDTLSLDSPRAQGTLVLYINATELRIPYTAPAGMTTHVHVGGADVGPQVSADPTPWRDSAGWMVASGLVAALILASLAAFVLDSLRWTFWPLLAGTIGWVFVTSQTIPKLPGFPVALAWLLFVLEALLREHRKPLEKQAEPQA